MRHEDAGFSCEITNDHSYRCHKPTGASPRKVRMFQKQSGRDCEGGSRNRRVTNQWRMVG